MIRLIPFFVVIFLTFQSLPAFSHYLWATTDPDSGKFGRTYLHFEDGPRPGIGEYLQPFAEQGKTWVRTLTTDPTLPVQMIDIKKDEKRWLAAELPIAGPRSIETYAKWGVWRFPDTGIDTLLHYYAKHLDVNSSNDIQALSASDDFLLDIVPGGYVKPSRFFNLEIGFDSLSNFINRWTGPSVEIFVRWKDQPAANTHVTVRGPTGPKIHVITDEKGYLRYQATEPGLWTFLTHVEENVEKGTDQGKEYDVVRYTSTLTLNLPMNSPEEEHP